MGGKGDEGARQGKKEAHAHYGVNSVCGVVNMANPGQYREAKKPQVFGWGRRKVGIRLRRYFSKRRLDRLWVPSGVDDSGRAYRRRSDSQGLHGKKAKRAWIFAVRRASRRRASGKREEGKEVSKKWGGMGAEEAREKWGIGRVTTSGRADSRESRNQDGKGVMEKKTDLHSRDEKD